MSSYGGKFQIGLHQLFDYHEVIGYDSIHAGTEKEECMHGREEEHCECMLACDIW